MDVNKAKKDTVDSPPATALDRYDDEGLHFALDGTWHTAIVNTCASPSPNLLVGTQKSELVSRDRVIAIDGQSDDATVLYAASIEGGDSSPGASPVAFKTVRMSGVPDDAISTFPSPLSLLEGRDHVEVFISTKSGTGLAENVFKQLTQPTLDWYGLKQHEHYDVHLTTSETTISELTHQLVLPRANKGRRQTILLLSGDGGMVDMINTLIAGPRSKDFRRPEVALLPFGTGNALANSSGITGDRSYGLRALLQGQAKPVPVFRAHFSSGARLLVNEGQDERELDHDSDGHPVAYGAVVCSWGLHATLVADSDTTEYRKFGAERFKMAGKEALFPADGSMPHAYHGTLSILRPGESDWAKLLMRDHGYILATLVSHLEAGFHISPSSRALDGKLRLINFEHCSGEDAMDVMTKAYQDGQHVHLGSVGYEEIEAFEILIKEEDGRWRRVCIDGKIIRVEKDGWVKVDMGAESVVELLVR